MATVTQRPDNLSLLRNLKSYKINTSAAITFKLLKGNDTVIEETYHPDGTNVVTIDIQEVVAQYLEVQLPDYNIAFNQSKAAATFTTQVDGDTIHSFKVVSGGVRKLAVTPTDFLKANWLTWQPQTKKVRWNQQEYLTYYFTQDGVVKVRVYLASGPYTFTLATGTSGQCLSFNTEMAHIFQESGHEPEELQGYFDIWVEDTEGTRLSYVQRYIFQPTTREEHYFLAVNSLGGVDTFCFTGARTINPSIEHDSASQAGKKIDITNSPERSWSQNTGHFGKSESVWLWEFFSSSKQWGVVDGNLEEIVLDTSSIQAKDSDNVNTSSFSFSLCEEGKLLKIPRSIEVPPIITVPSPAGELFFLAPRVVDYPDANLEDSLLFLVQSPYVQEWKKISLGTLKAWIKEIFTPYEDLPLRLEILDSGDGFLAWGETTHLSCRVWKGNFVDVTNDVTAWSISRDSGVPIEDAAWLLKEKVRHFDGEIDIAFTSQENDLGETTTQQGTTFTITANMDEQSTRATIVI